MEIQTNHTSQVGYKAKGTTILLGFSLILVPIAIGVLMTMPQVMTWITISWKEIIKGAVVGLSILPVILFATIKGGAMWYKKVWVWGLITVAVLVVMAISLMGETSVGTEAMKNMVTPNKGDFY
ncbi:MAG: hypothetical protein ACRC1P_07660 [Cellulosilyticaceae bacterium]